MTNSTKDNKDYSNELNSRLNYETKILVGEAYLHFLDGETENGQRLLEKINNDPILKGRYAFVWNERCGTKGFTIEALA